MTYDATGLQGLDYELCTYEGSRLQFRGPQPDLTGGYVAFLGATETFGKFVQDPYPALLDKLLPASVVNLGMINGGVDAYLADPAILKLARKAELRVVQVFGALNQSNHYYKVHPRRNDRFIGACETLIRLFPEVDFAEFHYTKAMLAALHKLSNTRYKMVCEELQKIWLQRMNKLLDEIGDDTILLWFAAARPSRNAPDDPFDPMLIDADMIQSLRLRTRCYVEFVPGPVARSVDKSDLLSVMISPDAVDCIMGANAHAQAAQALQESCLHLLKYKRPTQSAGRLKSDI